LNEENLLLPDDSLVRRADVDLCRRVRIARELHISIRVSFDSPGKSRVQAVSMRSGVGVAAKRAFQIAAVLSCEPVTICEPSGLNATDRNSSVCPRRTASSLSLAASQIRAVRSDDAVAMRVPSGLNAADVTKLPCRVRTAIGLPVAASQIRAVWSCDVVTIREPSGLKAAVQTMSSWPDRVSI
jgi:hypothetical protein